MKLRTQLLRKKTLNVEINQKLHQFWISGTMKILMHASENDLSTKTSFEGLKYPIETSMDEKKLQLQTHEFEYPDESKTMIVFEVFGLQKDWSRDQYKKYYNGILLYWCEIFKWSFDTWNRICSYWQKDVECLVKPTKSSFWISQTKNSNAGSKVNCFSIKFSSTIVKYSIDTSVEKIKMKFRRIMS